MGRVLVLGNASMDVTFRVPRLPQPGETLMGSGVLRAPGGKGLNQAAMAARAGAEVQFCAAVGDDADGRAIEAALRGERLAALDLVRPGPATDQSVLLVAPDAENVVISVGDCADALPGDLAQAFAARARSGDILLMQGNLPEALTRQAAAIARLRGARVVLNTAPLRWGVAAVFSHCHVVVANAGEATAITGLPPEDAAAALAAMGPVLAIVTLGAAGCTTGDGRRFAAPAVLAIDTTGAGDAFCGALAAALSMGMDTASAITAGQRAAAGMVTRRGAYAALPKTFDLGAH